MSAQPKRALAFVKRLRAKYAPRAKPAPAFEQDPTDEGYALREQLVEIAGRVGRLGRHAGLAGEAIEALRGEVHRLKGELAARDEELRAERLERTVQDMRRMQAAAFLDELAGGLERGGVWSHEPVAKAVRQAAAGLKEEGDG